MEIRFIIEGKVPGRQGRPWKTRLKSGCVGKGKKMKIKINLIKREHDKPGDLEDKIKRHMKIIRKIKKCNRKCSCTLRITEERN